MKPLSGQFQPKLVTVTLDVLPEVINAVQSELTAKCQADDNKCFGYFPGMSGAVGIESNLPASEAFAKALPALSVDGKDLRFNFVRMSLIKQANDSPYHLDSDAKTALTGDTATVGERLVWRFLLNLSDAHPRTLGYLHIDPFSVKLATKGGYIHCTSDQYTEDAVQRVVIPPRNGLAVSGVLFCASRVLHTGQDDAFGHFVSGYGCEE